MATRKQRSEEEEPKTEKPEASQDEVTEVELSEPEEAEAVGDDEEEESPAEQRAPRRERRANRYREQQERAEKAEREAAEYRQQLQQYQQHLQAQQFQAHQQQAAQQGSQELDKIYDEQRTLYAAFEAQRAQGLSDDQSKDFERRARELEQRKHIAIARQNGLGQQVDPRQLAAYIQHQQIVSRYSDIAQNQQAWAWGQARVQQRLSEGAQYTQALLDEVADETRRQFRMNGHSNPHVQRRPPPDDATKARFSGVPARMGGGGGGNGGAPVTVRMGRAEKKLAQAKYPELDPEKAWQKWANGPGRRAMLAMQKER